MGVDPSIDMEVNTGIDRYADTGVDMGGAKPCLLLQVPYPYVDAATFQGIFQLIDLRIAVMIGV